ncbi:probable RNA-dependent RNA polymerase 5 isoform X2 [Camellia sinensis]|uniref:probable RNA-dependent RNA polymerase 5 isoform X2 n=1 Tax=Camellia sinensis TaxID=4442 RepID=UPI0010357A2F|nr:probable RNA-dependent RNA polymerase 5 isoform X2 [Camellia sinensis]
MAEPFSEVRLPQSVESMLQKICIEQFQSPPDTSVRKQLELLGEEVSLEILGIICTQKIRKSLSGFIMYLAKDYAGAPTQQDIYQSPHKRSSDDCYSPVNSPIRLPQSVESVLQKICVEQYQSPPGTSVRKQLELLGEEVSLEILGIICTQKIRKSLSGFIMHLAKDYAGAPTQQGIYQSPHKRSSDDCYSPVNSPDGVGPHSQVSMRPVFSPSSEGASTQKLSPQLLALSELEFRKGFLILSYIGSNKLEDFMSADDVSNLKNLPMWSFEAKVWDDYGEQIKHCSDKDRPKYLDWDSGKTHLYYCHVYQDGSYTFKGPYLNCTRTHLQRVLGDENVLIVKFAEEATSCNNRVTGSSNYDAAFNKIAEEGILVGLRRFRFFVFKDGGKEEKKKSPTSSSVKCYFVRMESLAPCDETESYILSKKTVYEARCLFMHVQMVSSLTKYMPRFSLVLSKTIKLQVDLASITIKDIEDIPCRDENGCVVYNEDREPLIHTDGTGYISVDIALKAPKDFSRAKYINDENFEKSLELRGSEAHTREPPLLMQIRLFYNGRAVKGTLLVNRKLPEKTIQVRSSMIKVETDSRLSNVQTFNSLEIVGISNKPKKNYLSRNLIALLSYGGVPKKYFLDILTNALEDAQCVYSNKRTALKVAINHGEMDDNFTVAQMILSGTPLDEPYIQYRLSVLAKEVRKGLKGGKLPISESFYLMGTADPTEELNSDEVCVILDNGQISGQVLVYRNPGLHFGDIHVLKAVYVKALEDFVGNAKYAIFFSTKGRRSVGSEIANGDFDGDMYWVSRNPELLRHFKPSYPWSRIYSTPNACNTKKPSELSAEELEHELFQLFKRTRFQQSYNMSVAADSWLAFMDRLLILGDSCSDEKDSMKETMHHLIDIYYEALDAPKSGKKVVIPDQLKAEKFPHYMGKPNKYHSTSVLGLIYEMVESFQSQDLSAKDVEVWKLPCFDVEIPTSCMKLWGERYSQYRCEMTEAMNLDDESKNDAANVVTKRYKQLLYGAAEFEESPRNTEDIYNEALAIYNITYDHAMGYRNVKNCGFAWRVAGSALFKLHAIKQSEKMEKPIVCLPSVLREVLN